MEVCSELRDENVLNLDLFRIGGEAKYLVYTKNDIAINAFFISRAPVRGFERLVRGKNPLFVVEATMRICGICHAAHGIASVEAFVEDIEKEAKTKVLRAYRYMQMIL